MLPAGRKFVRAISGIREMGYRTHYNPEDNVNESVGDERAL